VRSGSSTNEYYAVDLVRTEDGNGSGKPVVAVAAGIVRHAGWSKGGWAPYGKLVYIEHDFRDRRGRRFQSLYAHLSRVQVRAGDRVEPGTVIGTLGGSSRGQQNVFGSHLHFALYQGARSTLGGGHAVVPEPMDAFEDLRPGTTMVACGAAQPLPVASMSSEGRDAAGGLTPE
jgi:murein DD-endopeptidase MepM/ murein hydrolase activator NlpD